MNCANHPALPVSAYCQSCGKPLCAQCVRSVDGVVYCEPCLAARLRSGVGGGGFAGTASSADPAAQPGAQSAGWAASSAYAAPGARPLRQASPVLAAFLGFIPGVGAMYNGQFVKAFAHVLIFVVLVGVSEHFDAAGMLVAAWVFYQVFDAIQTAIARNEGRPLPDPFGLNDLGQRLGVPAPIYTAPPGTPPVASPPTARAGQFGEREGWAASSGVPAAGPASAPDPAAMPPSGANWQEWAERAATAKALHDAGVPASGAGYPSAATSAGTPPGPPIAYAGRPEPIGAIVLIGVGILFLLSTLGVFRFHWIGRGWPVLIIALGAWLLFRRLRTTPSSSASTGGGL